MIRQSLVRRACIPNGAAGTHSGWYTICRGAYISRRQALSILIHGPRFAGFELIQTQDPEEKPV